MYLIYAAWNWGARSSESLEWTHDSAWCNNLEDHLRNKSSENMRTLIAERIFKKLVTTDLYWNFSTNLNFPVPKIMGLLPVIYTRFCTYLKWGSFTGLQIPRIFSWKSWANIFILNVPLLQSVFRDNWKRNFI